MAKTLYKYKAFYKDREGASREFTSKHKLFNHLESRITNKNIATNLTDKIVITMEEKPTEGFTINCIKCSSQFEVTKNNKGFTMCKKCYRKGKESNEKH